MAQEGANVAIDYHQHRDAADAVVDEISRLGVIAFTMALAREVARKNISANAVAPGFIETDMTRGLSEPVRQAVNNTTPMGRMGRPEAVAAAVVFLASPAASYITGQVIGVNGGMYM